MILSSVTNILLDLLFVAVFRWGVAGAAVATVLSHMLAAAFCTVAMFRVRMLIPGKGEWGWDGKRIALLLRLGLPVSAQNCIIAVGGIYLQSVVNGFGVVFIAGYTATNKLYGLLEIAAVSYGYAMTTYAGQNLGAREIQRIRTGVRSACVIGIITSVMISAVMIVFGKWILRLFLSGEASDVESALETAYAFLRLMSLWLPVLYLLHVVRSALQGLGNTVNPLVSGIVELLARTSAAFVLPGFIGGPAVFWCEVLAWIGADLILIPGYYMEMRKINKRIPKEVSA
jgi:Na+-driven multidrug efflux pump